MSDLPQEASKASFEAFKGLSGLPDRLSWESVIKLRLDAAIRAFLDHPSSDFVSLADVTRGMGSTSCNCRSQIEERFGKSAPSATPDDPAAPGYDEAMERLMRPSVTPEGEQR